MIPRLYGRVFDTPLAIAPQKLQVILGGLKERIDPRLTREQLESLFSGSVPIPLRAAMGYEAEIEPCYSVTDDGIAVISICGTLVKKASGLDVYSGLCSYEWVEAQMNHALSDTNVRGILLDIDSPGGETHGLFDLCDRMYGARGQKPIYAVANDAALSAAYCLASAADRIWVTRTGGVGSIGVFALHCDQSGLDSNLGLKYTYIHAGAKKVDGNPHEPLADSALEDVQAEVDREYGMFVTAVVRNRQANETDIRGTEAGVLYADGGVPLLADAVGTRADALEALRSALGVKGVVSMPAIARHKTETVKKSWNGSRAKKNLREGESQHYYESAFAYRGGDADPTVKSSYSFIHHEVGTSGDVGAANLTACSTGIGILNGGRGGQGRDAYTPEERRGIYAHLAGHLRDGGEEPPELKSEAADAAEGETEMAKQDPLELAAATAAAETEDEMEDPSEKPMPEEPDGDEDGEDEDGDGDGKETAKQSKKARAAVTPLKPVANPAKQIAQLCTLAGCPARAAEFIAKDFSVARARQVLYDERLQADAEKPGVDANFGSALQLNAVDRMEQAATRVARNTSTTKAKAYEMTLRQNPSLYLAYLEERDDAMVTSRGRRQYSEQMRARFAATRVGVLPGVIQNSGDAIERR